MCVGFLAGLMYLLQSYSLKHGRSPTGGLRLPSLESLERVNSRSLALSALLMGLGFASGLVLSGMKHSGEAGYVPWTDPIVLSLAAMLLWLLGAEVFRLIYPAARRGRKVAYLTLAAFVFLIITLASFVFVDSAHGRQPVEKIFSTCPASPGVATPGFAGPIADRVQTSENDWFAALGCGLPILRPSSP